MDFYLLGLLCAAIGVIPLLAAGRVLAAVVTGVVAWPVLGTIFYLSVPFYVWPWYGAFGIMTVVVMVVSVVEIFFLSYSSESDSFTLSGLSIGSVTMTVILLLVMIFSPMSGCNMFRANEYANLIGETETRVWTQDVQPKDPRHIRMVSHENANFLARQAFGQAGAIGSQFEVIEKSITPQLVAGRFCVIVPVDFRGFWSWNNTGSVPGYIVVNGEDPAAEAKFVALPKEKQFKYTPNACFEYNLERYIWRQGYGNYDIDSYTLELDDENKPWWTVTLYKPACFAWGKIFAGILLVDPVSGQCQKYGPDEVPSWVDVAVPSHFVKEWVDLRGKLANGFWNSVFSKAGLVKGEKPVMVYGSDGEPYYVTGVTSSNDKDSSLVGLYYTHTRTGKSVYYAANGSTDSAILEAVNKNSEVQYRKLHGTVPQIYNIHGVMACVVPLLNDNHIYQGVAICDVKNVQIMGVGKDQFEALRQFERSMPLSGHQIAPDMTKIVSKQRGLVQRIALVPQGNEVVFYIYLKDLPHVFTGGIQLSPKLPLTREGDEVVLEYYASGQSLEPMHAFDNPGIPLSVTVQENHVQQAAAQMKQESEQRASKKNSKVDLDKLSPEEAKQLMEELRQRQGLK